MYRVDDFAYFVVDENSSCLSLVNCRWGQGSDWGMVGGGGGSNGRGGGGPCVSIYVVDRVVSRCFLSRRKTTFSRGRHNPNPNPRNR